MEKGSYSERDAVNIVRQMVQGVAYLHAQGIAHRDLKVILVKSILIDIQPENLLCADPTEDYKPFRVVIADFGLSKNFTGGEKLETSCGTPDYVGIFEIIFQLLQPQKSSQQKVATINQWTCGQLELLHTSCNINQFNLFTFCRLCGFSPFVSSSQTGLFEKIIRCEYDFPDPEWTNISDDAKDFIRHLLVKDPETRFNAEKCLNHKWLEGHSASTEVVQTTNLKQYNAERKATKKTL